jgi:Fe-S-cluster containining protein
MNGAAAPAQLAPPDEPPLLAVPDKAAPKGPKRVQYNCAKCPGYCCSYPIIDVTQRDIKRLARHFGIEPEVAEARFTRAHEKKRVMRRQADKIFGRICRFFDTEKRQCTIYHARPAVCRTYPDGGRCGYYDFLSFERRLQDDKDWTIEINHR